MGGSVTDLLDRWEAVMDRVRNRGLDLEICPSGTGANLQEIEDAEEAIGRRFPDLLRELLLRSSAWSWQDDLFDVRFMPPESIVDDTLSPADQMFRHGVSTSLDGRAKTLFYSSKRLTFAYTEYRRFQIDDDPAPEGSVGQVVVVDFGEHTIAVVANSLEQFVSHGLDCVEATLNRLDNIPFKIVFESGNPIFTGHADGRVLARAWKVLNDAAVRLETFALTLFSGPEWKIFCKTTWGFKK